MTRAFADLARDPRIIRGVHHYCDEWCDMCPVASRCLAFRCMAVYRKEKGRRDGDPTFRTPTDAVEFSRTLCAAEGAAGAEVGRLLDEHARAAGVDTSHPLTRIAWQYALAVSMWLVLTPDDLRRMRTGPGPSPEEVVLWYHLRIYLKLLRALVTDESTAGRAADDEVNGLAKLTVVSIARSRKGLRQLMKTAGADTVIPLIAMLDTLERGIDARFPHARSYIRAGLDAPVG